MSKCQNLPKNTILNKIHSVCTNMKQECFTNDAKFWKNLGCFLFTAAVIYQYEERLCPYKMYVRYKAMSNVGSLLFCLCHSYSDHDLCLTSLIHTIIYLYHLLALTWEHAYDCSLICITSAILWHSNWPSDMWVQIKCFQYVTDLDDRGHRLVIRYFKWQITE